MDRRPYLDHGLTRLPWWTAFDPRCSLRARAALLVATGGALFTALLIWLAGTLLQREVRATKGAAFDTLAFQLGDKVDRALYERYRTLVHAASLDPLRRNDPSPTERRRLLESLVESSPDFAWIGFADATGRILSATGGWLEHTDAAQRPWFRGAREQPFLGALRDNPELARQLPASLEGNASTRFMELAVPVQGADGRFAGVLAAQVRWGWSREVQLSVVPEAVARDQVAATVYGADGDILLDSGALGWSHPPAVPAVGDTRRARGWMIETTPEGGTFLTGFSRSRGFREFRGLGWIAVVRQPVRLAFAPVAALQQSLARWGFGIVVAGVIAAWWLAGRLTRRLHSITAAAQRIREGDILAVLPHPPDESEMSRMCRAVGGLVEDLRVRPENPPAAPPPGERLL
ncbi:MAG: HAMP domain-containing protein [Opitutaceae bacterium]|nr:HAMP domain-containing protein [Opitutaceae bacterium]